MWEEAPPAGPMWKVLSAGRVQNESPVRFTQEGQQEERADSEQRAG